ncbi:MAG TPA: DUF362 domain-containing protein [Pyrinomonadaceae bacterium]|jgi:uncharacterized protein (DUF362 family)|nr:DUF362 domain-containing protein [Pyrinomonadaceae bacterium]
MSFDANAFDPRVASARADSYDGGEVARALESVCAVLGWRDASRGPLGGVVKEGARVLVKPNFVLHENQGPWGVEPLLTHGSVVRAVVEAALDAGAGEVTVGDAPVQGCDFEALLAATRLKEWSEELAAREPRFRGVRDFRRTVSRFDNGVRRAAEGVQSESLFALFDLGAESLLEPITDGSERFRVTCYDPRLLARTHARGRHQYLVAREVLDADVVINLPKLKTHMKAGVTCALKNLIGINGNKEYLPHHRVGGSVRGGDCYPGGSQIKRALEYVFDRQNTAPSPALSRAWAGAATQLYRVLHRTGGDRLGVEGSWSGNDTIWRTCLDLNRILLYGRTDATMAETPQRRVVHVVDAVVAGQGNGPLAPQPLALGLLLAGECAAAVDYVGARLLGYEPERVPVVRHALEDFRWPLARFGAEEVRLAGELGEGGVEQVLGARELLPVVYPLGWRDAARAATTEGASASDASHALTE